MITPRKPQRKAKPFQVIFRYGQDEYHIVALDIDASDARKAFQLCKQTGDKQTYEVQLAATGSRCNCQGFRFRMKCKHLFMLQKARMLD